MSALDQTQYWQQLRDEASYIRQSYENEENRKTQLYATAIGNEAGATKDSGTTSSTLVNLVNGLFGATISGVSQISLSFRINT